MDDLAKAITPGKGRGSQLARGLVLFACLGSLAGCMNSMSDPLVALRVDRTQTGSIPAARPDADTLSDEGIITEAVSQAEPDSPYPWSNSATGAAGVINSYSETEIDGRNCRDFSTSRHSFEGIAIYSGQACQTPDGHWALQRFQRAGG